ncbi:hypothetical protein BDK51DRAFT_43913 [Blyttiomyces helicus]|uniref:Uncharacterized protein n=1 Tax=Blyttiomyces helicus TaxID=388810 RepID=A0A4P9WF23_9FUNG|nr:hypothetical protein BDK51DRAFT_43913 [Blyttiomyces helicus]|eukprot:RKO90415.1 hypothetical protein BDK51DRAFT_43913 [Blyttiomyces helicus]
MIDLYSSMDQNDHYCPPFDQDFLPNHVYSPMYTAWLAEDSNAVARWEDVQLATQAVERLRKNFRNTSPQIDERKAAWAARAAAFASLARVPTPNNIILVGRRSHQRFARGAVRGSDLTRRHPAAEESLSRLVPRSGRVGSDKGRPQGRPTTGSRQPAAGYAAAYTCISWHSPSTPPPLGGRISGVASTYSQNAKTLALPSLGKESIPTSPTMQDIPSAERYTSL